MEPKICEHCGGAFLPPYRVTAAYWARRRYCSIPCRNKARRGQPQPWNIGPRIPLEERFWAKVDERGPDECWEWQGTRLRQGYGVFMVSNTPRQLVRAHRTAYELVNGPIEAGRYICHHCDNPPCCNPRHLYMGTASDNARDRERRNRGGTQSRRGQQNGNAKLSDEQVAELRARYVAGGVSQTQLAKEYGVIQPHISRLVRGLQRS